MMRRLAVAAAWTLTAVSRRGETHHGALLLDVLLEAVGAMAHFASLEFAAI